MELQGKVIAALPQRSGESARGKWVTQEFVIQHQEGQYPRHMCFTVFGEERLQRFNIQVGQYVLVAFDIDAREWNDRWFTDIRAYDVRQVDPSAGGIQSPVEGVGAATPTMATQPAGESNPTSPFPPQNEEENQDNLPF